MHTWQAAGNCDILQQVEEVARKWALLEERSYNQANKKAFEEWLEKAAQGGAGQLHTWTKSVVVWKPLVKQASKGGR